MRLQPTNPVNFGVYQGRKPTKYGYIDTGIINNKKLDIYYSFEDGQLKHKLYYLTENNGINKWIKSKLKYFNEFGVEKIIRSKNYG